MIRVGIGYDVHRLAAGGGVRLGGVDFPRAGFHLVGHSDADVIVHAAADAILGAAGLGDIGRLFPNTSPRHRGRNSLEFLVQIRRLLLRRGFALVNLDCTLLAERPKISGQARAMEKKMASALGVSRGQIHVKATTQEGLGFVGREEGLAALAAALIEAAAPAKP